MIKLPVINNQTLWQQALTHRSYAHETQKTEDNERLEFLGDAVLGFVIAQLLYRHYPDLDEAYLTRLRSRLLDQKQLDNLAQQMELGKLIHLGKGAEKNEVRNSIAVLSDTFEAIIGAYFLDQGIIPVQEYVQSLFIPLAQKIISTAKSETYNYLQDAKTLLQEWAIANLGERPIYELIAEVGPPHARTFTIQVVIKGKVYGVGEGSRKQEAEKKAALATLAKLSII